jgi:hypothetical protein
VAPETPEQSAKIVISRERKASKIKARTETHNLAKVAIEGSNRFARSSRLPPKLSLASGSRRLNRSSRLHYTSHYTHAAVLGMLKDHPEQESFDVSLALVSNLFVSTKQTASIDSS